MTASLPPLYATWAANFLDGPIPAESNATCDDCAMVVNDSASDEVGFSASVKCCTFMPELRNFLVGAALLDPTSEAARGRASINARIDAGIAVSPLGLGRSAAYDRLYDAVPSGFGRDPALLCPHFVDERGGICSIWHHREATCTTYFCTHVRGTVGRAFWSTLQHLLKSVEESLAAWCVREIGLDGELAIGECDDATSRAMWGAWYGRERELYARCSRLVASLSWADVARIGGPRVALGAEQARSAHARLLEDGAPERPVLALVQITPRRAGRVRLSTQGGGDPLDVPEIVATLLPYFDGRPIGEALDDIRRREGVRVEPSFVRKLSDFGMLRDAAAGNPT